MVTLSVSSSSAEARLKVKQAAGALQRKHINCGEMHSDLDQATRDDVMFKFKSGQLDVLVVQTLYHVVLTSMILQW